MKKTLLTTIKSFFTFYLIIFIVSCGDDDSQETNLPPEIADQSFSISENSDLGSVVGTVLATDPNDDALTFEITNGNTDNTFGIEQSSGELTVSGTIDFETTMNYSLTIEVNDGENVASAVIQITVVDVNENTAPTIVDQTFMIDENSEVNTVIGTVVAQDAEQSVAYVIITGNDNEAFTINETSGELAVNMPGLLDFETNPSFVLGVEVSDGSLTAQANVTINLNDVEPEAFTTETQIVEALENGYDLWESYIELSFLLDAVYSNAINSPSSDWDDVFDHSLNSLNTKVEQLWDDGRSILFLMNNIILSAEEVFTNEQELTDISNQALLIRAHVYYLLVNWFENIPIETDIQSGESLQDQKEDVISLIKNDLNSAANALPGQWSGEVENVTSLTAEALIVRLLNSNDEPVDAFSDAEAFIQNGSFSLDADGSTFDNESSEIIWGFDQTGESVFANTFDKGNYVSLARLTEMYLISALNALIIGDNETARTRMNTLLTRSGQSELAQSASTSELQDALLTLWEDELGFEGNLFFLYRQLEVAESLFTIENFRLILPIPQSAIDENPNLFQNQGY